jgi:hypothetical protein
MREPICPIPNLREEMGIEEDKLLPIFTSEIWDYLLDPQTNPSLSRDCVVIGELLMVVILNPSLFVTLSPFASLRVNSMRNLMESIT